ncbi:separase [Setaria italica]|uniref:separase n=1 Tax=Setaria italica TaxID=4555 RepID=UPI000BE556FB|nr:separase [Setaria italica]
MAAAAADLLAALSSPSSHAGLHSRFAAYLRPFTAHLPTSNPSPGGAIALRPLAKRFLPFLGRALLLLPPLVRASSGDAGGSVRCADELFEIYALLLDCLEAISPCLAGKPYSVLLQRGRFVCCLESRGCLWRAEEEAVAALDALRSALSPPAASTKSRSRRGGAASAASIILLPDPAGVAGEAATDPDVATLAVELTVCLANCASKGKVKEAATYERVLSLVEQLQPWLPILPENVSRKYLTLLLNAMSRCAFFLAAEPSVFGADDDLVHRFCVATLEECVKVQTIDRLLVVARKICSSLDLSWEGSTRLLLDLLKCTTDSVVCLKADLPKAANDFLVFVAYVSRCFLSVNRDRRAGASVLLFKAGSYFSEVSSPIASVLLLYATGLYFSAQQMESDVHLCISEHFLNDKKQHTNAVWKNFSEGKAICYSGNLTYVLTALHQFIDSSLMAHSCAKMSSGDKERLHEHRGTLLNALVSAIKISFATSKAVEAPKVLELCCQTVWVHVRRSYCRLSEMGEGNGISEVLPKDTLKDIIVDAFTRIAKMVDVLHRCGAKVTREIVVKSLLLLVDGDMSEYLNSSLILIKLWVKEELAFGSTEPRGTIFCAQMQTRIIDILLDEMYSPEEYFLERSRVLVRKAGVLRSSGMQNISSCLESLSEAISLLLKNTALDLSQRNPTVINQLATAHCLHAHCAQEGNLDDEVVLGSARSALDLWSEVESFVRSSPGMISQQESRTIVPLLCSLIDLLAIKRMFPTDLVLSQSYKHSNGKKFSFNLSVDEVDKVASSLVSEVASSGQPIFIAGCLYYDLSEKLLSGGHLSQAFSYGKEALNLRKKLLKKEFKLNLGRIGSGASQCCGEQGFVCLEACGSTVTEIWPDSTRSTSMKDSFLTPWNILRCYLESILQVALMHELSGNDAEAEVLVRTGKEISHFHKLPVFHIAFTSLLGQLYRKRQLWDEAESELKYARDFLAENDSFISCKLCRLTLKISLDMKDGDKKHSTGNFSGALVRYKAAMDKLNSTEFLAGTYDGHKPGGVLCNKDYIGQTWCEACKHGKEPLVAKDDVLPTCISCKGKSNCYLNGSDCRKDDICDMFGCWNCLLVKSLNSGSIQNILQFRFNCVLQRYLLPLLLKKARAMGAHNGEYGAHEIYNIYWQCISLLYFRSLPQERAEILHSMSLFVLKGFLPEQSRDVCCTFSSVGMSCVVPWLLKAFVLSRESPSLFQKISIGSLSCHDLASLQVLLREMVRKGPLADSGDETDECVSKFPRLAGIEHIEKHVSDFFHKLPDVPTVCISMLGDDYVDVFGENLLEDDYVDILGENVAPSFFPAWMLISRFHSTNKPTAMLLPVGAILEEMQSEGSSIKDLGNRMSVSDKKWQCPWGYAITDHVAPTFRSILEENFMSLSSATLTINDGQANCVRWWAHRMKLNNYLDKLLKDMEELWLGPWKCLLLGHQPSNEHIEAASSSIVTCLEEFKLEVNPELIKAILGGAVSVDEVHECLYQLILYKGYVGRGQCCEKDRLRSFSSWQIDTKALETLKCLIENTVDGLLESADRGPVILILDINVQMLPWENLPVLRNQEIYRMPSMGNIFLALTRCNNHYKDGNVVAPRFPAIDPFNTFYLLNPNGDLSSTQKEFEQFFRNYKWKGNAGHNPTSEELVMALANYDLFLYFGHGSGAKYINLKEIEKLNNCASAVLMGCSSGALHCKGSYAPHGAPLSYLSGGSPAVVANLWDVSDKDIDRFSKALLHSWLREDSADDSNCLQCSQLTQEFESINIGVEGNDRRNVDTKRCSCRQRRVASNLSKARSACRLPHLIGASPVCYGVPTIIRR